jgi:hypothetical protein
MNTIKTRTVAAWTKYGATVQINSIAKNALGKTLTVPAAPGLICYAIKTDPPMQLMNTRQCNPRIIHSKTCKENACATVSIAGVMDPGESKNEKSKNREANLPCRALNAIEERNPPPHLRLSGCTPKAKSASPSVNIHGSLIPFPSTTVFHPMHNYQHVGPSRMHAPIGLKVPS